MAVKPRPPASTPRVLRLGALRRVVRDLAASVAFYRHGLGFRVVGDAHAPALRGVVVLALGQERIELVAASANVRWPAPADAPDVRFQHVAVVASDIERAYHQLQSVAPVSIGRGGPQQLPQAAGGVRAFKFRDPDGHPLEIIEFPAGTGDRRWHAAAVRHADGPTLGIDHSAICVADAERSIAFYAQLGFSVATRQRNVGPEQARLDGLDVSEVEVIALRPPSPATSAGPHLELLAYLTPQPTAAQASKAKAGGQVTQDRLVWRLADAASGAEPGLLIDPDGHIHELLAPATAPQRLGEQDT